MWGITHRKWYGIGTAVLSLAALFIWNFDYSITGVILMMIFCFCRNKPALGGGALLPELSSGFVGQPRRPACSCDRRPYGGLDDLFPAGGPADFLAHPHRRQDQQMVLLHFLPRPSGPHRPGEIFGFDCIKERE